MDSSPAQRALGSRYGILHQAGWGVKYICFCVHIDRQIDASRLEAGIPSSIIYTKIISIEQSSYCTPVADHPNGLRTPSAALMAPRRHIQSMPTNASLKTATRQIFGLSRSYLTHASTCPADACRNCRPSNPTQILIMEKSPSRALLRRDVPPPWAPSWRRMGRALEEGN